MFETKVYKECYPFSMEVLYDVYKRNLFVKLLHNREASLFVMTRDANTRNRKTREYLLKLIRNENQLINEIEEYIQNNDLYKINDSYCNWLIDNNRVVLLSDLVSRFHFWNP